MKFIYLLLLLFLCDSLSAQTSVYELNLQNLQGKTISMAAYKGKKIMIASISPENLKNGGLAFLDSIQSAYPNVAVIAIPASDFGGLKNTEIVDELKKDVASKVTISMPVDVRKDKGASQSSIMNWLTSIKDNKHFDDDVETDNQLYVISESGFLYAVMIKGFPLEVINNVLTQEDMKQ